ncbi:MAG: preprotein translocase subunit SecE [Desulfobacterales bacterium]|nr:preprotein translocase subunit SecE [Desulfobacterales bacterium]
MGRLIRKKPAAIKKKKSLQASDKSANSSNISGEAKDASKTTSSDSDNKKKPVLPSKKTFDVFKTTTSKVSKESSLGKAIQFLREVKVELKKVTWPSRKQTTGSTVVVLILVVVLSFFLGIVDIGLSALIKFVLG